MTLRLKIQDPSSDGDVIFIKEEKGNIFHL